MSNNITRKILRPSWHRELKVVSFGSELALRESTLIVQTLERVRPRLPFVLRALPITKFYPGSGDRALRERCTRRATRIRILEGHER